MTTQYKCFVSVALLAVILFLMATGCAAEKPMSNMPEQVSSETNTSSMNQIETEFRTQSSEDPESDKAELFLDAGSEIEMAKDTTVEEGEGPVLTVKITGLEFAEETLDKERFKLENLPEGLDFAVERVDSATARINLFGIPTKVVERDGLTLSLGRELFRTVAQQDHEDSESGESKANAEDDWITVKGTVPISVFTVPDIKLTGDQIDLPVEVAIEDQKTLTIALTGLEFADELDKEYFKWERNLPEGLDFTIKRIDNITAEITLSGTPAEVVERTDLTLTLRKELFHITDRQNDENNETDDGEDEWITVRGAVSISVFMVKLAGEQGDQINLEVDTAIQDGVEPAIKVTLTGLKFVEELDEAQFRLDNLPAGLDFSVERIDDVSARITLFGTPIGAIEERWLSLTIGRNQIQPQPEQDLSVTGSVTITVAAKPGPAVSSVVLVVCGVAVAAVIVAVAAMVVVFRKKDPHKQQDMSMEKISKTVNIHQKSEKRDMSDYQDKQKGAHAVIQLGKLHNIGRRSGQQDSLGSLILDNGTGIFAVVADGMGGLSGGDQVSQSLVMSMLQQASSLAPGQMEGVLSAMVRNTNGEINHKLGPDGIYKSGSTVVAVLVRGNLFHWISVGDSRIYLYRGGSLIQLNQEHTYEVELMQRMMNGEITAAEAANDPQRRGLTSFIGMGRLKYVDASLRPILLQSGDRILLMTDGVFNHLPETAMADTLLHNPDVQQAAEVLEKQVLALRDAAQDNFTAIILGIQG